MKNAIRNLTLLTLIVFAAAYDSCYIAPQIFQPASGFSCISPRWLYESQWRETGESFVMLGIILLFLILILWNRKTSSLIILSIDKSEP
jgi:hypothetical protein